MCPFLQDFPIYYNIGSQRSLWWFPLCLLLSPHYFPYFANLGLFFHYFRHRFARGLSIFVFSKNKLLFCWYFVCFLISISLILALNLIFLSFYFFWVLISFVFLGVWDVALGHSFLSTLLIYEVMAINFPPKTALDVHHRYWKVVFSFLLTSRNLLISSLISSMTHSWLTNVLFSLQIFVYFLLFLSLLSSTFIALWSDRI
jgi:hypothetical protein